MVRIPSIILHAGKRKPANRLAAGVRDAGVANVLSVRRRRRRRRSIDAIYSLSPRGRSALLGRCMTVSWPTCVTRGRTHAINEIKHAILYLCARCAVSHCCRLSMSSKATEQCSTSDATLVSCAFR